MSRRDYVVISIITIIYALVAFYALGDTRAPQTFHTTTSNEEITVDLGDTRNVGRISLYLGLYKTEGYYYFYRSTDGENWQPLETFTDPTNDNTFPSLLIHNYLKVFSWHGETANESFRYLKIVPSSDELMLGEVGITDALGNAVHAQVISGQTCVCDEQILTVSRSSNLNGTYFDEIYFPRTAFEILHKYPVYETTHPPLGKVIISASIWLFGMTPFGWRFPGTLFGVLMLPVLYSIAKKLGRIGTNPVRGLPKSNFSACPTEDAGRLASVKDDNTANGKLAREGACCDLRQHALAKSTEFAALATILFAADFMHFAQTRLATIDSFAVFFILLMYKFALDYSEINWKEQGLKKSFIPLVLCGISFGLGVSTKWICVFSAPGIAFIIIYTWIRQYRLHKPLAEEVCDYFKKLRATVSWCLLFFILIPAAIYFASYLPQMRYELAPEQSPLQYVLDSQVHMYSYHSAVTTPHPFESKWSEWPTIVRPMFAYTDRNQHIDKISSSISSFGNPAVWWLGIITMCITLIAAIICCLKKSEPKIPLFILASYISQYAPWILIGRTVFIYHYFASVPFVVLSIAYVFLICYNKYPKMRFVAWGYCALAIFLFGMFYPVLSGMAVQLSYVKKYLIWRKTWIIY